MKKILLGTSAVALAGATAGTANAAEWDLDWGGYFEASVGYASVDSPAGTDFDGVDVLQDAEIIFTPSITLDNGLTFGVDIQLEGNTNGDQIDESFAFVKGSFGEILIGSENSAGYKMTYGAPDVTWVNVNSGSLSAFIPFSGGVFGDDVFRGTLGSSFLEVDRNNDAQRITYFTPRFAGFQLGASYARDALEDSSAAVNIDAPSTLHDIFDIGANYVNSFGEFDVALSGRWGIASLEPVAGGTVDGDPTVWSLGINLGYAGATIGGSYAQMDGDNASNNEGEFFDVGISYETGPWGFSATYAHGEDIDDESVVRNAAGAITASRDEELQQAIIGVNYKLGPGVTAGAYGGWADFEEDNNGDEIDGWVIGTGFKLNF